MGPGFLRVLTCASPGRARVCSIVVTMQGEGRGRDPAFLTCWDQRCLAKLCFTFPHL